MDYSKLTTFLSELTAIQAIGILFVCICLFCITWTMLTYITNGLASSAKGTNKKLLDNMSRLKKK